MAGWPARTFAARPPTGTLTCRFPLLCLSMITKILLTALIIIAVVMYFRRRTAMRVPAAESDGRTASPWYWRLLPAALLLAALGVSAVLFWIEWREEHRIFTARVIDTRTGAVTTYLVYRDGVQGRTLKTVDGRTVTLADVERLELERQ